MFLERNFHARQCLTQANIADDPAFGALRAAETTGRPLGNAEFVAGLERVPGRPFEYGDRSNVPFVLRRAENTAQADRV